MFESPSEELRQLQNINRLMAKRDANNGYVSGYHGTSASKALSISETGFEDRIPVRGEWKDTPGVYFWDEEYEQNAFEPGRKAAREDDDTEFAVIKARLYRPAPDYEMYRPQWRCRAQDVGLLAIRYYDLSTSELSSVFELN